MNVLLNVGWVISVNACGSMARPPSEARPGPAGKPAPTRVEAEAVPLLALSADLAPASSLGLTILIFGLGLS